MKNLTLSLLGLVLIYLPASVNSKQCFSQKLGYPCCSGNSVAVIYTDLNGDWGVENGDWCGIVDDDSKEDDPKTDTCFSLALGYPCCKGDEVFYTDGNGNWGIENGNWCGIGDGNSETDTCFAAAYGYPCCESCVIKYSDENGEWGKENKQWCGIKDICKKKNYDKIDINQDDFEFLFLKLENNKKNMLYSPLSIKYALNMLQEGAAYNTYAEINKVIGNTDLSKYESIDEYLSMANGLFINATYYEYIKPQYINTIKNKYDGDVIKDKFENANNINQWIEDKTLGIIKDMISDQMVQQPDTVMFIINALAMNMKWELRFDFEDTRGREFLLENGEKIEATTMYSGQTTGSSISYYIGNDITAVTMNLQSYNGIQFEFMAIMPDNNLSNYVNNVTKEQINEIDKNLISPINNRKPVVVYIPKFKFNYDLNLKDDLKKLGINEAFSEDADFSNMAYGLEKEGNPYERLYVSDALHKSDIDFSEEGLKAAAVSVIVMTGLAGSAFGQQERPTPVVISIDKPFMFIVRDKSTKDIWFTGTVYEPNLWENDKAEYKRQYIYG